MRNRGQFHPRTYVPAVGARSTESDLIARTRNSEIHCGVSTPYYNIYMILHIFCITKALRRIYVRGLQNSTIVYGNGMGSHS